MRWILLLCVLIFVGQNSAYADPKPPVDDEKPFYDTVVTHVVVQRFEQQIIDGKIERKMDEIDTLLDAFEEVDEPEDELEE